MVGSVSRPSGCAFLALLFLLSGCLTTEVHERRTIVEETTPTPTLGPEVSFAMPALGRDSEAQYVLDVRGPESRWLRFINITLEPASFLDEHGERMNGTLLEVRVEGPAEGDEFVNHVQGTPTARWGLDPCGVPVWVQYLHPMEDSFDLASYFDADSKLSYLDLPPAWLYGGGTTWTTPPERSAMAWRFEESGEATHPWFGETLLGGRAQTEDAATFYWHSEVRRMNESRFESVDPWGVVSDGTPWPERLLVRLSAHRMMPWTPEQAEEEGAATAHRVEARSEGPPWNDCTTPSERWKKTTNASFDEVLNGTYLGLELELPTVLEAIRESHASPEYDDWLADHPGAFVDGAWVGNSSHAFAHEGAVAWSVTFWDSGTDEQLHVICKHQPAESPADALLPLDCHALGPKDYSHLSTTPEGALSTSWAAPEASMDLVRKLVPTPYEARVDVWRDTALLHVSGVPGSASIDLRRGIASAWDPDIQAPSSS